MELISENGSNQSCWLLEAKAKKAYLTRDIARPSSEFVASNVWEAKNAIVMAW